MGRSMSVALVYGIDLGGADGSWHIEERPDYSWDVGPWYSEDDDAPNLLEQAMSVYMDLRGIPYSEHDVSRYFEEATGLGLDFAGVGDYQDAILTARNHTFYSSVGELGAVDLAVDTTEWDAKIQEFLDAVQIKATKKACWMVVASYG